MEHLRKGKSACPKGDLRRLLLAGGAAVAVIAMAGVAHAQDQSAPPPAGDPLEQQDRSENPAVPGRDIVVTGSRIVRKDFDSTSPIVTVDSRLLEQSGSVSLEANLNKLPQFAPALTQFVTQDIQSGVNNTVGASTVSLRQLGANRNLVLIDGRRGTPINGTGVIDINSIPSAAIERVEIVTGGASSTYGADAVGGVVNFILKKNYNGFNVDGQASLNEKGDGFEYRLSANTGASTADGRAGVMLGVETYERKPVYRRNVDAYSRWWRDPRFQGDEFLGVGDNYFQAASANPVTAAGVAASLGLDPSDPRVAQILSASPSYFFNSGGNIGSIWVNTSVGNGRDTDDPSTPDALEGDGIPYTPLLIGYTGPLDGLYRKQTIQGLLTQNTINDLASSPMKRWSFFGKAHWDFSDNISFYTQATFTKTSVQSVSQFSPATGNWAAQIPHGSDIYHGNAALNIPDSVLTIPGFGSFTNPDYLAVGTTNGLGMAGTGRFGLNCPVNGGCTNSQVFPVSPTLAALLDSRADPNATWTLNQYLTQLGPRRTQNDNVSYQFIAGFQGKIPGTDWTWDVYGSHGETIAESDLLNFGSVERFRAVVQSPNYGMGFNATGNSAGGGFQGANATCATGISPFSPADWSDDCKEAIRTNVRTENRVQQTVWEATAQGSLFALPYGNLRAAAGVTYRKNSIENKGDSSATAGSSFLEGVIGIFPQGNTTGEITTKEAYGELLVPILADLPFAKVLNLELGYRLSDASYTGTASTYKINGEWAPVDWLHFRGGYQKSVRAPNLGELFQASTSSLTFDFNGYGDPCNPNSTGLDAPYSANQATNPTNYQAVRSICRALIGDDAVADRFLDPSTAPPYFPGLFTTAKQGGNINVDPEIGKTWTVGAVLRPASRSPWLAQLRLTVDYYNVVVSDAITLQSVSGAMRRCFDPEYNPDLSVASDACQLIERNPSDGSLQTVGVTFTNGGRVETAGVDTQIDWGLTFRDAGINIPGRFGVNLLVNYLDKFRTTDDIIAIPMQDYAGTLGGGGAGTSGPSYRWKSFATFSYGTPGASLSLQWQHLPKTRSSTPVSVDPDGSITGAPAYDLFNLSGTIAVTRTVSFRWGVDNLFNKRPPLTNIETAPAEEGAQPQLWRASYFGNYDTIGRRFFIGASAKF